MFVHSDFMNRCSNTLIYSNLSIIYAARIIIFFLLHKHASKIVARKRLFVIHSRDAQQYIVQYIILFNTILFIVRHKKKHFYY